MFDLSSSKLIVIAVIALLVVGPKDLPKLLRTLGHYIGMIRRQAAEFRTQFDDAMKQSELSDLKKQVEDFGREAETAMREAETAVQKEADAIKAEADRTAGDIGATVKGEREALEATSSLDAPGLPSPTAVDVAGAPPAADAALSAAVAAASPKPAPEKVGA